MQGDVPDHRPETPVPEPLGDTQPDTVEDPKDEVAEDDEYHQLYPEDASDTCWGKQDMGNMIYRKSMKILKNYWFFMDSLRISRWTICLFSLPWLLHLLVLTAMFQKLR